MVPTPRDSKLCSLLLPSHERITLVESGHAVGRGGVRKLSRRPGTPNFVPCFFLLPRHKTLVESGHAAGKGWVGELSQCPGTPNYFPASSFSRENIPG